MLSVGMKGGRVPQVGIGCNNREDLDDQSSLHDANALCTITASAASLTIPYLYYNNTSSVNCCWGGMIIPGLDVKSC